jgi:2-polyprenyl-3-methyl-5-hydroxy-6-metoxy-1,4-benzoquinol methylase
MSTIPTVSSTIPVELVDRARRERDFFNQHSDPEKIRDQLLMVASEPDAIPREIAAQFPSLAGKCVCDVGCGYGVLSAYFAKKGARVFAFDVAETNVKLAERATQVNRVRDRVSLQVMQGECLAFADNTFDLVFGNAVLHHLDTVVSAREIRRILKPGGVAIFREPLGENRLLEWARGCSWRSQRHTPDEHSLRYADVETLRTVFPRVVLRECELLTVVHAPFRKVEGMIAIRRGERALQRLEHFDRQVLRRCSWLRPFASYCVVSMFKPA